MNKIIKIGITGHRFLPVNRHQQLVAVLRRCLQNIVDLERSKDPEIQIIAVSPLAEGADTIFAQQALDLGLPLHVILPFEYENYLNDFSGDGERELFKKLYHDIPESQRSVLAQSGNGDWAELFLNLGKKIVDEVDYLVTIWDGLAARGAGGTQQIVAYAASIGKEVLRIDPNASELSIEYYSGPARNNKTGNGDALFDLPTFISRLLKLHEQKAISFKNRYMARWKAGFILGLVEICFFSLAVAFHPPLMLNFLLMAGEFLCLCAIIMLLLFGRSTALHGGYVHNRLISERMRIKVFFARLGCRIAPVSLSPIYTSLSQKEGFNILDHTRRMVNLCAYSVLCIEDKKQILLKDLIMDQYLYHEEKARIFTSRNTVYRYFRQVLFLIFVAAVSIHFFRLAFALFSQHLGVPENFDQASGGEVVFEKILFFLVLFIPPLIAASEALKYLYEWHKIISSSKSMSVYFRRIEELLKNVRDEADMEVFLNNINKDMLIENLEWEKYMQHKNEVPT